MYSRRIVLRPDEKEHRTIMLFTRILKRRRAESIETLFKLTKIEKEESSQILGGKFPQKMLSYFLLGKILRVYI